MKFNSSFYDNKKVAIAVSGGADSMALVLLAIENNMEIVGLTVDHKLRPEAEKEAKQVQEWLKDRGVEHYTLAWEGEKPDANIQAEARNARYDLMTDWCKNNDIDSLLTAHTMDDQAETFLLNLGRGSGVYGLSAMDYITEKNDINIIRPLLNVSKEELKQYLISQNQEWIEDPSNKNTKYNRVKIRNILPALEAIGISTERINLAVQNLCRTKDFIETEVDKAFNECIVEKDECLILDVEKFYSYHTEISYRLLKKIIKIVGKNYYPPRFEKIERLYNNMSGKTLGNCKFSTDKNGDIIISCEKIKIV